MIAVDTSSLIAYFAGEEGMDINAVHLGLEQKIAVLPPVVLSEILSDPKLPHSLMMDLKGIPLLDVLDDYWERTGILRSQILKNGHKARLADSLIAQICIDHDVPLITRDKDFRNFVRIGGLRLFE